jgi:hypothetical protein
VETGTGHKTMCKDGGESGSEPTRLKFTGIQTGRYTRRCTSSGGRTETARIVRVRSQRGSESSITMAQRRINGINIASVHKAVHQLWLSARIVRIRSQWGSQRRINGINVASVHKAVHKL